MEAAPGGEESGPAQWPGSAGLHKAPQGPPRPSWLFLMPRGRAPFLTDLASRANASSVTSQPCPSPQLDVTWSPSPRSTPCSLSVLFTWPTAELLWDCTEPAKLEDLLRETPRTFLQTLGCCEAY